MVRMRRQREGEAPIFSPVSVSSVSSAISVLIFRSCVTAAADAGLIAASWHGHLSAVGRGGKDGTDGNNAVRDALLFGGEAAARGRAGPGWPRSESGELLRRLAGPTQHAEEGDGRRRRARIGEAGRMGAPVRRRCRLSGPDRATARQTEAR